jgi:hypothetical protein
VNSPASGPPDHSRPDHQELGGIFDMTGVTGGPDGIKRYDGLPRNLVQMLRAAVDTHGAAEAVVETGSGPRLSYASLWDRAAAVAGGLRSRASSAATGWRSGWATAPTGCWPASAPSWPTPSSCRSIPGSPRRKRTTW